MLSNIRDEDGENTAMQVLDTLRALRKDYKNFRMLITGSIGLHHVLNELKQNGYRNEPTNDMFQIEIEPLESKDASFLAKKLLEGEDVKTDDIKALSQAIADKTDNFPFYIHHVVKSLKLQQQIDKKNATIDTVETTILEKLVDDNDPWELRHYEDRLTDYYGEDATQVELILDALALIDNDGLKAKELLEILKQQSTFDDLKKLRELLSLLNQDHYLSKDLKSRYRFRFPLIQRWWKIYREL